MAASAQPEQDGRLSKRQRRPEEGAIVTGAASGIGLATAKLLAQRGCRVLFADRDVENGKKQAESVGQLFCFVDVSKEESVVKLLMEAKDKLPNLSFLVNCAGCDFVQPLEECPTETFERAIVVNLRSVFLMCREALPLLKATKGSVVNVASIQAYRCFPGFPHYASTKGGIISMTRQLAGEYAKDGVRFNTVSPGDVDTNLGRNSHRWEGQGSEPSAPTVTPAEAVPDEDALLVTLPAQAVGEAIVAMLQLRGVTGQDLVVDGGCSIVGVASWQPFPKSEGYSHVPYD